VIWLDGPAAVDVTDLKTHYNGVVWREWEARRGVCWTRNAAMATARGPLVLPVDADDRLVPNAVQRMLEVYQQAGPHSAIYSDVTLFGSGIEMVRALPDYDFGMTLKTCLAAVTILHPKQAWAEVGGYDVELEGGMEDWAYLIGLGAKGYCGVHIPEPLLWYRSRPNSRRAAMRGRNQEIVGKIHAKFPEIYAGNRPEGCCAGDGRVSIPSIVRDRIPPPVAGAGQQQPVSRQEAIQKLRYVGAKQGQFYVILRPTKRTVRASARQPILELTTEEADWLLARSKEYVKI